MDKKVILNEKEVEIIRNSILHTIYSYHTHIKQGNYDDQEALEILIDNLRDTESILTKIK